MTERDSAELAVLLAAVRESVRVASRVPGNIRDRAPHFFIVSESLGFAVGTIRAARLEAKPTAYFSTREAADAAVLQARAVRESEIGALAV